MLSLSPTGARKWYFCCVLAVQPERGRCRTWAKFLTVLVTVSAVPTVSEWKAVAAEKRPESGQEGKGQVKAKEEGRGKRERKKQTSAQRL